MVVRDGNWNIHELQQKPSGMFRTVHKPAAPVAGANSASSGKKELVKSETSVKKDAAAIPSVGEQKNGQLTGIFTTNGTFPCEALVFAVGHSARDTFAMLMDSGLVLECKPFSVGFRAEHLQSEIEKSLYHEAAGHPALPRGEYQLSQHVGDRCVYTFCMCPGGQVVASASETGHVVTNGMSYHARDGRNANAAVVVSVGAEDFAGDPRRAIAFQRELEAKAYAAGRRGGAYAAPAENVQSFLEGKGRLNIGRVEPTYDRGVVAADLGALLPGGLADTLRAGLRAYERKIAGYTAPEAILTGLETRTSSPVRLKRPSWQDCTPAARGPDMRAAL